MTAVEVKVAHKESPCYHIAVAPDYGSVFFLHYHQLNIIIIIILIITITQQLTTANPAMLITCMLHYPLLWCPLPLSS